CNLLSCLPMHRTAAPALHTLSLHDALPIWGASGRTDPSDPSRTGRVDPSSSGNERSAACAHRRRQRISEVVPRQTVVLVTVTAVTQKDAHDPASLSQGIDLGLQAVRLRQLPCYRIRR